MEPLIVIALTAVLFIVMILLLATKSKAAGKITGAVILTVAVGGLLLYGYGFSQTIPNFLLAVIRALLATLGMFLGKNEISAITSAPLMQHEGILVLAWIIHLLAFYITAGAAVVTVGAEALKKLRLWLTRRGQLNVIYGIHEDSLALGKQLLRKKGNVVLFVDEKLEAGRAAQISAAGGAVRNDAHALTADARFLRTVGLKRGNRKLTLYALHKDTSANIRYARLLLDSMEKSSIEPQQTRLVIQSQEEAATGKLQVSQNGYGFGYVSAVQEPELAARLLVHTYPPCNTVDFDADGRATEDFEALVVGFGQIGQAVLRQLVMNGQFVGSTFHAAVFSPDCQKVDGYFANNYSRVLEEYDITFHPYDARSRQMYEHLRSREGKIRYVAICTGDDKLNHELAEDLSHHFRQMGIAIPIYQCSHSGVKAYGGDGVVEKHLKIYTPELLSRQGLDTIAMHLNHSYQQPTEKTVLETWMECDYFSRQSCRAAADFAVALLRCAGKTEEEALQNWDLPEKLLLNLSKTEHLRWNAFHFCMGFAAMTDEELEERGEIYRQQLAQNGKATIRITKDMAGRRHACLVGWDELKALSIKEERITGVYKDYQKMDTDNVLAIPTLLRAAREHEVRQ